MNAAIDIRTKSNRKAPDLPTGRVALRKMFDRAHLLSAEAKMKGQILSRLLDTDLDPDRAAKTSGDVLTFHFDKNETEALVWLAFEALTAARSLADELYALDGHVMDATLAGSGE